MRRLKINDLRFHDPRHTFAIKYLINGGDINTLKEILGHSDISTTGRYLTTPTEHKRKSMRFFEAPKEAGEVIELKKKA